MRHWICYVRNSRIPKTVTIKKTTISSFLQKLGNGGHKEKELSKSQNLVTFVITIKIHKCLSTGCPTQMLTSSDQILKIEKSHMPKSKPCFEILEWKPFRWHLETWENQNLGYFKNVSLEFGLNATRLSAQLSEHENPH